MRTICVFSSTDLDRIREYALKRENLYCFPNHQGRPVGDNPGHVAEVDVTLVNPNVGALSQRIRVVFTITDMGDHQRFRHASFSLVSGETSGVEADMPEGRLTSEGLPAPSAVQGLGMALGFKGTIESWVVGVHAHDTRVIVVAQELEDA